MPAYSLALTLAITAPLLAPGYLLLRDAVSTPRAYLTDAALGLTEAAPRALPQDFLVAVASHVVDGGVVVKLLLVAGLWLAGWGAARLADVVVPAAGLGGQFVAATLAIWNPYVAERLLQGHWSLLVGYGCLPWVAAAVLRLRAEPGGRRRSWWPVLFWIALAGLTPTGLMLAATVALVCCAGPRRGRSRRWCAAVSLGAAVLGALPWLVAPMVAGSLSSSAGRRRDRVRGQGRAGSRHVGQPRGPRRHLERPGGSRHQDDACSRSSPPACCSPWSWWVCRRRCDGRARGRCWCSPRSRWSRPP